MPREHTRSESGNFCVVCCEDIEIFAIGQCDHPICYVCSVRMRVLGKEKYCAVCRTDLDKVLLTKKCGKWSTLQEKIKHGYTEKESGLCYADKEVRNKVSDLLQYRCPKCNEPPERTFNKLRDHLKREHHLFFCDICLKHLQKFTHELKVYSRADLARHRRVGDSDDKAYKGHPLCEFCDDRYLDDEDLHRHLRKNHFWCHLCERDGKQLYFHDYVNLRGHFREEHFLCEEDMCKYEQYTSVFRSEIDLQAHVASKHSQKMTKAQVRQARQLEVDLVFNRPSTQGRNITGHDYSEVHANEQRFRRNRGKGHNTTGNRQEEQNVQPAITKSVTKKEEDASPQQNKTTENPINEKKQAVQALPEDDFPFLNKTTSAPKTSQSSSPKASPKSSRKTDAYTKKTKGLNSMEDFPILGGSTSKAQQNGTANDVPNTSQSSPKSTRKAEAFNKKAKGLNTLDEFPKLGKPSKTQQSGGEGVKANTKSSPKTTRKQESFKKKPLDNDEDFPTLGKPSKPQQNGTAANEQTISKVTSKQAKKQEVADKKSQSLDNLDDFPSLGKPSKSLPKNPPPGFSDVAKDQSSGPSQVRAPPGFQSNVSPPQNTTESSPQSSTQFTEKLDDILLPKEKPKPVNNNEKTDNKTDSKGNQLRNQNLIENIKVLLEYDVDKFVEFKQLSGKFRQGLCTAETYYNNCTILFGPDLPLIFNELVTLLPDHDKQEELLRIHNDAKILSRQGGKQFQQGGGKRMLARDNAWGPIQTNSAPVKKEAWQKTRSEVDFPSLPPAAPRAMKPARIYKPKTNLALKSAWVRGK